MAEIELGKENVPNVTRDAIKMGDHGSMQALLSRIEDAIKAANAQPSECQPALSSHEVLLELARDVRVHWHSLVRRAMHMRQQHA